MKNKFLIKGEITEVYIKRQKGEDITFLIDTEDLEKINSYMNTWMVLWNERPKKFYVYVKEYVSPTKYKRLWLHRVIMDTPEKLVVDHINKNTLDNRKSNLRNVEVWQNNQNLDGARCDSKTGIRGVQMKKNGIFYARAQLHGKNHYLGSYKTAEEAEKVVIQWRKENMQFSNEAN